MSSGTHTPWEGAILGPCSPQACPLGSPARLSGQTGSSTAQPQLAKGAGHEGTLGDCQGPGPLFLTSSSAPKCGQSHDSSSSCHSCGHCTCPSTIPLVFTHLFPMPCRSCFTDSDTLNLFFFYSLSSTLHLTTRFSSSGFLIS